MTTRSPGEASVRSPPSIKTSSGLPSPFRSTIATPPPTVSGSNFSPLAPSSRWNPTPQGLRHVGEGHRRVGHFRSRLAIDSWRFNHGLVDRPGGSRTQERTSQQDPTDGGAAEASDPETASEDDADDRISVASRRVAHRPSPLTGTTAGGENDTSECSS